MVLTRDISWDSSGQKIEETGTVHKGPHCPLPHTRPGPPSTSYDPHTGHQRSGCISKAQTLQTYKEHSLKTYYFYCSSSLIEGDKHWLKQKVEDVLCKIHKQISIKEIEAVNDFCKLVAFMLLKSLKLTSAVIQDPCLFTKALVKLVTSTAVSSFFCSSMSLIKS